MYTNDRLINHTEYAVKYKLDNHRYGSVWHFIIIQEVCRFPKRL